ncbi:hypothetical protein GGR57DRAFT_307155 [Xylariaceae sp. FL1272]|nr:hypothetical protein GGR57DRAFT_307155 [Xylariaceae sp. FL1272]
MADEALTQKVQSLSDISLAILLSLINREHCILSTPAPDLEDLITELQLTSEKTFGLSSTIVTCTSETTLPDFVTGIQLPTHPSSRTPSPLQTRSPDSYFGPRPTIAGAGRNLSTSSTSQIHQKSQIPNIVIAKNLNHAPKAVQIQCLELMRTRRIFTRTSVQACPKHFLLIACLASETAGAARLTKHLNDRFYISHWCDPEDGFPNLDEEEDSREGYDLYDDGDSVKSTDSVVRRRSSVRKTHTLTPTLPSRSPGLSAPRSALPGISTNLATGPLFTETDLSTLATLSSQTHVAVPVLRYLQNILSFLRMHRAVVPGSVSPNATPHFRSLVSSLAALHGLPYATPEMVQLAVRKVYTHRLEITAPERERSMQWGSDLSAVKELLEGVEPEDVVEDVLGLVDVPL